VRKYNAVLSKRDRTPRGRLCCCRSGSITTTTAAAATITPRFRLCPRGLCVLNRTVVAVAVVVRPFLVVAYRRYRRCRGFFAMAIVGLSAIGAILIGSAIVCVVSGVTVDTIRDY